MGKNFEGFPFRERPLLVSSTARSSSSLSSKTHQEPASSHQEQYELTEILSADDAEGLVDLDQNCL